MPRVRRSPSLFSFRPLSFCLLSFCLALTLRALPALAAGVDPALLAGLKARSIGPAGMSGRIAAIAARPDDPDVLYAGAATGGLWRSTNAGLTWEPLFDAQPVAALGAVAIDPTNPDIVWAGTGEGNPRNSVSVGNGIYKSLDGGRTWTHLGLEKTERIHRILLHPTRSGVAWVAALGQAWGENAERGVWKTTDGGASWTKVLYVDERTGAADLVLDPKNPDKLFAAMWDYRRWPWSFRSGGPGSGLHVTYDGGATWKRFTEEDGMPKGDLGRIGVAISPSHPEIVYALVEAEESALLRSEDGGQSWRAVNTDQEVADRPFYYADIRVDPEWPQRLYSLASRFSVSDDSGKSFRDLGRRRIHSDNHALWIDPADPTHLVLGSDGGLAVSRDRGESWQFVSTLPLGQYYHVAVDGETPYNVYGGMQDNGSWRGPSAVRQGGGFGGGRGIPNHAWLRVGFGDGFDTLPDPDDPTRGYAMSQGGFLQRWDLSGGGRPVRPPQPGEEELRFNWNAAIEIDPFDPATVYYGSQYVHKSTDRGLSWEVISPDLTTDNPEWQKQEESGGLTPDVTGAENFTTLVALAASPLERGQLWAGSDDGRLSLTRDGGATWQSLEGHVPGVPKNTWIPHIFPSRFDAAEAFVVFDNHRRSDWKPYVYRTRDFGATWQSLATENLRGYALAITQDPVDRDLLFLGTEFGLWVSRDGGKSWLRWTHGVPTVSVMDLLVHPRDHDLVLGTHGRAAFILDDISPLRHLDEAAGQPLHLFPVAPARQYLSEPIAGGNNLGDGEFFGENRPYGALITFWAEGEDLPHPDPEVERGRQEEKRQRQRQEAREGGGRPEPAGEAGARRERGGRGGAAGAPGSGRPGRGGPGRGGFGRGRGQSGPQVKIEIANAAGTVIRIFEAPITQGLNRAAWDLRRDGFRSPPREQPSFFFDRGGPEVGPGTYAVTLRYGKNEARGTIEVLADPDSAATEADWQAREAAFERIEALREALAESIERIQGTGRDLDVIAGLARATENEGKARGEEAEGEEAEGEEAEGEEAEGEEAEGESGEEEEAAGPHREILDGIRAVKEALGEVEKALWEPPGTKGIASRTQVDQDVGYAERSISAGWDAPSPTDLAYLERAEKRLTETLGELNRIFTESVAPLREKVRAAGLELLKEEEPVTIGSSQEPAS